MSVISNMLISCSICEGDDGDALNAINTWCMEHADGQVFKPISMKEAGGGKKYCDTVWACSGNYFPWREFMDAFPSFPWVSPESAVCIINDEHHDYPFVIYAFARGK